jgi:hypothetical protein
MTDPWSAALAEAYAAAPQDVDVLDTLELRHPALVDALGAPSPIRLVRDHRDWQLQLEAGAPLDGGEVVTFVKLGFDIDLPDSTEAAPAARLSLSAVNRDVIAAAEQIITVRAPVEVTYRAYIAPAEGAPPPEPSWVVDGLKLRVAEADLQRMSGLLTFDLLANRAFPALTYRRQEFPGLAR